MGDNAPRILADPDEVMSRLGSIESMARLSLERMSQIETQLRQNIHELRDRQGEHQSRILVAEAHIAECKVERQIAAEVHKVVQATHARVEKGEDRNTLLDQRLLKVEQHVDLVRTQLPKIEGDLNAWKTAWSGWKTFVVAVATAAVSAAGGGYLTHLFGWGTPP